MPVPDPPVGILDNRPVPTLGPEFDDQLDALAVQAQAQADAARFPGLLPRVWQLPETSAASSDGGVDLADPGFLINRVPRTRLNASYAAELRGGATRTGGRLGALAAYKSAVDYLATMERAYHASFVSRTRALYWAAARRVGHADGADGVLGAVRADLTDRLAAAYPECVCDANG